MPPVRATLIAVHDARERPSGSIARARIRARPEQFTHNVAYRMPDRSDHAATLAMA